jgi:peptidyl-prolyl cis-trans isomerase C
MTLITTRLARTASALTLMLAAAALTPAAFAQDAAPAPATEAPAADAPAAEAPAAEAPAAEAAAAVSPDAVVATVAGEPITEADLVFAAEDLAADLQQMPPEERRPFLLRVLIDMKVMANAARAAGTADTPEFAERIEYLEDQALRRLYFTDVIAGEVTEESVRAAYDSFIAEYPATEEVRASHILVDTQEEANEIKAELDAGGDFAAIAAERSIDPGAANGGDLGFFAEAQMVEPFGSTAFAMTEPGQISDPIQTQFGWHIIRFEERRTAQPPTFEQVGQQLQQQVLIDAFNTTLDGLMADTEVEIADPELEAAVNAQNGAQDATEAPADAPVEAPAEPAAEAPAETPAEAPATAPTP